ncbi:hypothetical protein Tco_0071227 [Tanacetum coccineum]
MKSQQSTNAFVKETFMDLKTQLETVAKNHQASIQNLETKFDRHADKQSGRPSGSLPTDLGASINLMPYSLYAKLSLENLKPTKISVRLADRSFQYPVGIAENMFVEVEPPTDLELKPLLDNLEYVFLEEPSFLPVIISSQLSKEKKNKLIYVLKKHKQAFALENNSNIWYSIILQPQEQLSG